MTDRRRETGDGGPGVASTQRILKRMEDALDAIVSRMEARMDRQDRDAAQRELDMRGVVGELAEVRRDLGELRDKAGLSAAETVVKTVEGVVASRPAQVEVKKKLWEKWQAWAVALVAFVAMYKNVGTMMRDTTAWWDWVIGRTPPADVRPGSAAKKDDVR